MKLKWTKGSIARDASQEEGPTVDIWTCEYENFQAMVIPTCIIHGNEDFGSKDCGWVYFIRETHEWPKHCHHIYGYTSHSFKTANLAKAAAREHITLKRNIGHI